MMLHERPDRQGLTGAGKSKAISGRIDLIAPQSACPSAWVINGGQTVAVSIYDNALEPRNILVLSLSRYSAEALAESLRAALAKPKPYQVEA